MIQRKKALARNCRLKQTIHSKPLKIKVVLLG